MSNSAVLPVGARQNGNQGGVTLATTLLELLTVAQSNVEVDRQAAQACLTRATSLLAASLERDMGQKTEHTFRGGLPNWLATRLATFIEQNLEQPIRSHDLIALTGLSSGHFFRTFKETFGQAPFAYIARLRIKRAQDLMLTTNHSLCQIAQDCGMCDQSHLTRVFRQLVGMTPGEWRRANACRSFEPAAANTQTP